MIVRLDLNGRKTEVKAHNKDRSFECTYESKGFEDCFRPCHVAYVDATIRNGIFHINRKATDEEIKDFDRWES